MRICSIDIGTNTILMLIADATPGGTLTMVSDRQVIARLGKGVDAHRMIAQESMERAIGLLREYRRRADEAGCTDAIVCGTSVLRDAANADAFAALMHKETGFPLRVLSGHEEAEYSFLGTLSNLSAPDDGTRYAVLDIGGGSTEIAVGTRGRYESRTSIDVGAVRLTERFLKHSPPTQAEIEDAAAFAAGHLRETNHDAETAEWIGLAGTLTTLAALDLNLEPFDPQRIDGHVLTRDCIRKHFEHLSSLSLEQIQAIPHIAPGRSDIILAGILILLETLHRYGKDHIAVSIRGLRFGTAMAYAAGKLR